MMSKTNYIKSKIDNTRKNSKYRLYGDSDETVNHIISKCCKLEQKEYKSRYDWVRKMTSCELCKRLEFDNADK